MNKNRLPAKCASHFDLHSIPDGYQSRVHAAFPYSGLEYLLLVQRTAPFAFDSLCGWYWPYLFLGSVSRSVGFPVPA